MLYFCWQDTSDVEEDPGESLSRATDGWNVDDDDNNWGSLEDTAPKVSLIKLR